jgi:hypothetical protein
MYKVFYLHTIDTSKMQYAIDAINKEKGVIKFVEHEKYDMYIIYEVV